LLIWIDLKKNLSHRYCRLLCNGGSEHSICSALIGDDFIAPMTILSALDCIIFSLLRLYLLQGSIIKEA
ncbi:hypothetical protein, partial [Proteus faecis]|uniref:hypothetical protein n=1 Tax=Proteus faecis TaxID=2050967 RepID=UPI00301D1395